MIIMHFHCVPSQILDFYIYISTTTTYLPASTKTIVPNKLKGNVLRAKFPEVHRLKNRLE